MISQCPRTELSTDVALIPRSASAIRYPATTLSLAAALAASILMVIPRAWAGVSVIVLVFGVVLAASREPQRLVLAGLLFALPLTISKTVIGHATHIGGAQGIELSIIDLPLLVLYVMWGWRALADAGDEAPIPRIYIASIGAFLVVGLLSLVGAGDPSLGLFELLRTARGVLILVYVAKHVDLRRDMGLVLTALLMGYALLAGETMLNQALGTTFNLSAAGRGESSRWIEVVGGGEYTRVGGALGSPNAMASYMALLLPLLFGLACSTIKPPLKVVLLVLSGLAAATLALTMSRGAWLAVVVACSIILMVAGYRRMLPRIAVAATFMFGGAVILVANQLMGGIIWLRLTASQALNVTSRYEFADIAIAMIGARPLLGVGLNNFAESMSRYDATGLTALLDTGAPPVHNIYLLLAAEMGIVGLAAFVVLIGALAVDALKASRIAVGLEAWVLLGVCGGFITILVQGVVDFAFRLDATFYTFWVLAGLTISAVIAHRGQIETDPLPLAGVRRE